MALRTDFLRGARTRAPMPHCVRGRGRDIENGNMAEQSLDQRPTFNPVDLASDGDRPTSPHLQIWGWTVSMASSITQRATGIALYAGSILLVAWLAAAALGEAAYNTVTGLLGSPLGMVVLFGFTWAQMFHMAKGILHLVWDSGHLIGKDQGAQANWIVYALSVGLTGIIWLGALSVKG